MLWAHILYAASCTLVCEVHVHDVYAAVGAYLGDTRLGDSTSARFSLPVNMYRVVLDAEGLKRYYYIPENAVYVAYTHF